MNALSDFNKSVQDIPAFERQVIGGNVKRLRFLLNRRKKQLHKKLLDDEHELNAYCIVDTDTNYCVIRGFKSDMEEFERDTKIGRKGESPYKCMRYEDYIKQGGKP